MPVLAKKKSTKALLAKHPNASKPKRKPRISHHIFGPSGKVYRFFGRDPFAIDYAMIREADILDRDASALRSTANDNIGRRRRDKEFYGPRR